MESEPLKSTKPAVIAVIPCYNEGRFIGDVVRRATPYVDQVIVIDDGSVDDTSQAAMAAGAWVVNHEKKKGYGTAARTCLQAARAENADIVVTLDGDGQHRPEEIPRLIAPIFGGEADLVIGSRFFEDRASMPRYRQFGIGVITWLFNIGSKAKVSDAQSGFRAYSGRLLDALRLTEKGFGFSIEVLMEAREKGFRFTEVPVSCLYHKASSSANPVTHGLGVALTAMELRLRSLLRRLTGGIRA